MAKCPVCAYENSEGILVCERCGRILPGESLKPRAPHEDEEFLYEDDTVKISQTRVLVGANAYSIMNISSVTIVKLESNTTGLLFLAVAGMYGVYLLYLGLSSGIEAFLGCGLLGIMLGMIYFLALPASQRSYAVHCSGPGGDEIVLVSPEKAYVEEVVRALKKAILHRRAAQP